MLKVVSEGEELEAGGEGLKSWCEEEVVPDDRHHEDDGDDKLESSAVGDAGISDECVSAVLCGAEGEEENGGAESTATEIEIGERVLFPGSPPSPACKQKRGEVDEEKVVPVGPSKGSISRTFGAA